MFALKVLRESYKNLRENSHWLREICILFSCNHRNILKYVESLLCFETNLVYIVFEFLPYCLRTKNEFKSISFKNGQVRLIMKQLLEGLAYLHANDIVHRDIKELNVLLDRSGIVKIADFGSSKIKTSPALKRKACICTGPYRAIELLLVCENYSSAIDIWSTGCLFAILLKRDELFVGRNEEEVIQPIFQILGVPTKSDCSDIANLLRMRRIAIPKQLEGGLKKVLKYNNLNNDGFNLLHRMFRFCLNRRITAAEALKHPYFTKPSDLFTMSDMEVWLRNFEKEFKETGYSIG